MREGKLMFGRGPGVASELVAIGENRFLMAGVPIKLEVSFKEPWPGTRLMSISTGDAAPLVLVYIGADSTIPIKMEEYAGTFQSDEADATITLVVKVNKL